MSDDPKTTHVAGDPLAPATTNPLDALHTLATEAGGIEAGVTAYVRGAADHITELLNNNDWISVRRFVEGLHSRAPATANAIASATVATDTSGKPV